MQNESEPGANKPEKPGVVNSYARWSGLAFSMLATIGLSVWAGIWLDDYFNTSFPVYTLVLSLLGVAGSLVSVIRQVNHMQH